MFVRLFIIALNAIFLENMALTRGIGTSTMMVVSKNKKDLILFGLSITYICTTASVISFIIDLFKPSYEESIMYMPFIYVLAVAFVYIFTLLFLWKFLYRLFVRVKKFIHLSAFNSAVLSALFINNLRNDTLFEYIVFGLSTGIGFFIACYFLSVSYPKLSSPKVPAAFRGVPATMIYIGIVSMAFFVLTGEVPFI